MQTKDASLTIAVIVIIISTIILGFNISNVFAQVQSPEDPYKFVKKFGSEGEGDGEFIIINGIDVDSKGNVYVIDNADSKIQKFDSNGTFIKKWGILTCIRSQIDF